MFDGFEEFDIATRGTTIHGRTSGEGPPVLLLHHMLDSWSDRDAFLPEVRAEYIANLTRTGTEPPTAPGQSPCHGGLCAHVSR